MKVEKFEDLKIWQASMEATRHIHKLSSEKPFSKDVDLQRQIRRAMYSVSANIAEGFEKNNTKEFRRYLLIAKGSLGEVRNHLHIAKTVGYIDESQFEVIHSDLFGIHKQIGSLISYLSNRLATQNNPQTR